ncbi:MAG: dihydropteroate synthase [Bacteroidales bacterium]|jgi:dihydropteroate synthase|nr:dihydropteroate synthase [Bacteroidales bacterium]MDN5349350.1 dihydropteroate synthase [Bacteroidales bacterium]
MQTAFSFRQIAGKNSEFLPEQRFVFKGKTLELDQPRIMGILNLTPDSFYQNSRIQHFDHLMNQANQMLEEGAHCLDLGAVSTRPGSEFVSLDEEADRLLEPLELLRKNFPDAWLSVDTYRSQIAKQAIETGAHMINDISGGTFDENMLSLVAKNNIPYVLMHILGTPETMHKKMLEASNVITKVKAFFEIQVNKLLSLGASQIMLDPGFGFGKTLAANYKLFTGFETINPWDFPLLAGVSRKSMIRKVLDIEPENALNGTTILHTWALQQGATFLRVHDVKAAAECIRLWHYMLGVIQEEND